MLGVSCQPLPEIVIDEVPDSASLTARSSLSDENTIVSQEITPPLATASPSYGHDHPTPTPLSLIPKASSVPSTSYSSEISGQSSFEYEMFQSCSPPGASACSSRSESPMSERCGALNDDRFQSLFALAAGGTRLRSTDSDGLMDYGAASSLVGRGGVAEDRKRWQIGVGGGGGNGGASARPMAVAKRKRRKTRSELNRSLSQLCGSAEAESSHMPTEGTKKASGKRKPKAIQSQAAQPQQQGHRTGEIPELPTTTSSSSSEGTQSVK